MKNGYHSRTPEEFQKYIREKNPETKKRLWIQIFILADILILFLVFFLVSSRLTEPGASVKTSNKISSGNLVFYMTGREGGAPETTGYFLFIENRGNERIIFPPKKSTALFKLTSNGQLFCGSQEITLNPRPVEPADTAVIPFRVDKNIIVGLPDECNNIYFKIHRGLDGIMTAFRKKSEISSSLVLPSPGITLEIEKDKWKSGD